MINKNSKYNYKKITMLLCMDEEEDKDIFKWLKKHKTRRNNFSVQLKNAIKEIMKKEIGE